MIMRIVPKGNKSSKSPSRDADIDYAAAADLLAGVDASVDDESNSDKEMSVASDEGSDDAGGSDSDDNNIEENSDDDGENDDDNDSENDRDNGDEEIENSDGDSEASSDDDDEGDEDDEDEDDEALVRNPPATNNIRIASTNGEPCTYDLRNLLAVNSHQINAEVLYSKTTPAKPDSVTIPWTGGELVPNEDYLLEKAVDGCSQLISALWQLPVERSDAGPLVQLPAYDESRVPRSLPLPPPKKETKWEKFAKEKGIPTNKEKRSRQVWDEATGTWMFRHGYQKANDDTKEWPIMEVKHDENPFDDPWDRVRETKRARVDKNRDQRMKNEERAGSLPKGTTNRLMKNAEHRRNAGKLGGLMDRNDVPPVGVPVDLGPSNIAREKKGAMVSGAKRGKESTVKALLATQRSTASLGKFDKMREGEPERKKSDNKALGKRKAVGGSTDPKVTMSEKERSLKLFKTVAEGGAKKEKDRMKGRLATGETALDYDFDDGLGPSSFRKKKGRAGAGKLKKMTKKRAK